MITDSPLLLSRPFALLFHRSFSGETMAFPTLHSLDDSLLPSQPSRDINLGRPLLS